MHQKNLTIKKILNLALQNQQKNNFLVAENLYQKVLKIQIINYNIILYVILIMNIQLHNILFSSIYNDASDLF